MVQFTFDIGFPPSFGRDDFLVAPCNAEAVAWLERWPDWPAPGLALYGPPGCGKSHLLAAFAAAHDGLAMPAAALVVAAVPVLIEAHRVVALDDIEALADEAAAFHLFNLARESGRFVVVAGRQPPARLPLVLADLASRLATLPTVAIGAPDDSLLAAVIVKLFADRQLKVGTDVVAYLLGRIERSFAAAGRVVEALDRASLAERRPVTVPLARAVLEAAGSDG
jgi:DnaA regulatory inactivator Hda